MDAGLIGRAAAMFAVTNVDDVLLLALYFGRTAGRPADQLRVVLGQYLGFGAILAAAVLGALGVGLLPGSVIPYLGLAPLAIGVRAAWQLRHERRASGDGADSNSDDGSGDEDGVGSTRLTAWSVAAVTFANGGDNLGVYVPAFAASGTATLIGYAVVFLALVAVWCALGRYAATRPLVARALARRGHQLLPAVLIVLGLVILSGALPG